MTSNSAAKLLPEGQSVIGGDRTSIIRTRKKEKIKSPIKRVQTLTANEVRKEFSESINKVCYSGEQIALTRRGRVMAILIPPDDFSTPATSEQVSSAAARDNISDILNRVYYKGDIFKICRREKVLAFMMSAVKYNQLLQTSENVGACKSWEEVEGQLSSSVKVLDVPKPILRKPRQSLP